MTIDKAIEILRLGPDYWHAGALQEHTAVLKLAVEALKGIKKIRKTFEPYVTALLPGETEN